MKITAKLSDGKEYQFEDVPAGISPEEAIASIESNKGLKVLSIRGEETGAQAATPPASEPKSSPTFLSETGRILDTGIRGGLSGIPALMDLYTQAPAMVAKGFGADLKQLPVEQQIETGISPETVSPNSSFMDAYQATTGGNIRRPETKTGQFLGEGLQGLIGALAGPGGLTQPVRNAAIGTMSGLSGEAADTLIDSENENPIYRVLGAILGGGLTAGGTAMVPNRNSIVRTATSQVPDSRWQKADQIAQFMDEKGLPYLNSQLLGPKSTLDDVVYEMSGHQAIRPGIMGHLQELPEKSNELLRSLVEKHFPINIGSRAGTIRDIKEAATDRIGREWDTARNQYRRGLAPQADNYQYYADEVDQLRQALLDAADNPSFAGRNTPAGNEIRDYVNRFIPQMEIGTTRPAGELNSLVKTLNQDAPNLGYGDASTNLIAKVLKEFTDDIYGTARRNMSNHIENQVRPLERSVIGDISRVGGELKPDRNTLNESVIGMMFPKDKDMTAEIQLVGKELGPDQVGNMMREFFTKAINTGEKVFDSDVSKFKQPINTLEKLVGTPTQRKNVEEGLTILTQGTDLDPKLVSKGFFDIVDNLETIRDLKIADKVGPVSIQQDAGKSLPAFMIATASRLGRSLWEKKTKETYEQIFNMLTTRDGLKQIQEIAKSPDPKATQVFLRSLLTSNADEASRE